MIYRFGVEAGWMPSWFSGRQTVLVAGRLACVVLTAALLAICSPTRIVQGQFQPPQPEETIFPLVLTTLPESSVGPHWESSFPLQNLSNSSQTVELQIFQADGTPVVQPSITKSFEIPPSGLDSMQDVNIFLETSIPPPPFPLINGWARLTPASAKVRAQSEIRRTDHEGTILTRAYIPGVRPATEFRTFVIHRVPPTGQHSRSAYAIVNPSSDRPANVRLTAFFMGSPGICEASLTLPPRNQIRKFFTEIFPFCGGPAIFRGGRPSPLCIRSDTAIAVAAVEFISPEGQVIPLPLDGVQP